jgi:hypothetical protein
MKLIFWRNHNPLNVFVPMGVLPIRKPRGIILIIQSLQLPPFLLLDDACGEIKAKS